MNSKEHLTCDPARCYLTSDWHLNHKNILKYDPLRPFTNLEDMGEYIISQVEMISSFCDTLVFCGDLAFGKLDEVDTLLERIKHVDKIWVLGNHDGQNAINRLSKHFRFVCNNLVINGAVNVNHYPPVGYKDAINYDIKDGITYLHGHDHNCIGKKWYGYNICYSGTKLIYNLKDLLGDLNER